MMEILTTHPTQFWSAAILVLLGIACWQGSDLTKRHWKPILLIGLLCFWVAAIIVLVTVLPAIRPCCHPV